MMHCAINATQAVCWEDGQVITDQVTGVTSPYPGFTPTFTADWDGSQPTLDINGNKISGGLTNIVGTIPQYMPFAGWPNI